MGAGAAIVTRLVGFGLINLAATQPAATALIYLLPLAVSGICAAMIAGVRLENIWRPLLAAVMQRLPFGSAAR